VIYGTGWKETDSITESTAMDGTEGTGTVESGKKRAGGSRDLSIQIHGNHRVKGKRQEFRKNKRKIIKNGGREFIQSKPASKKAFLNLSSHKNRREKM